MARVTESALSSGDVGISQTLAAMRALIDEGVNNAECLSLARTIAGQFPRQQMQQACALRNWLASVWVFVNDPKDRELLRDVPSMIDDLSRFNQVYGDCDEAAILGAALGKAMGLDAVLTVFAFRETDNQFAHVFASLLTDDEQIVSLDVTKPPGPVPPVTRELTIDV